MAREKYPFKVTYDVKLDNGWVGKDFTKFFNEEDDAQKFITKKKEEKVGAVNIQLWDMK